MSTITGLEKPVALPPRFEGFPWELSLHPQWCLWRWEWLDERWTKPPYMVNGNGRHASSTNPATWAPLEDVSIAYEAGGFDGVGFMLDPALGYVGVDLDDVVDPASGAIDPEARRIVDELRSYTEHSPSGHGLRIILRGTLPAGWRKTAKHAVSIEMYDRERYLTITGHHLVGTPETIEGRGDELTELHIRVAAAIASGNGHRPVAPAPGTGNGTIPDDAALLERARAARNGPKFAALWAGDPSAHAGDDSAADLALCSHLAFWTGRDVVRIDRLFRQSGLMRPKWDQRSGARTYGARTLARAIADCHEIYGGGPHNARPDVDHTTASAPPAEPRLRLIPWSEMTAGPVVPVSYDWHGWVALATVALIAGAGESLKSWLALSVAIMRAAGRAPFDEAEGAVPPAGLVIIFSAENALPEDQRRCGLLKAGLGLPDDLPLTFIPAEHLCFSNDVDYAEIEAVVAQIQPVVIVIDSAIAVSGLEQENDNAAVRDFMKRRILPLSRKHGATVYLIVHSPKPSLQPGSRFTDEHVVRGAGDWRNAADTVLYLRRDATLGRLAVVVKHGKHRVGPKHAPMWFTLEDVLPDQAVRLIYGGAYDDPSGQGEAAGLLRAVLALVDTLKTAPGGLYVKGLLEQALAAGTSKASARRALEIVRGKRPWPGGVLRGQKHPIVAEDRHGRSVFLTFLAAQWPAEDEDDDA